MFTSLKVGQPYLPLKGRADGVAFDATPNGLAIFYNFSSPEPYEISSVKQGASFEIRYVTLSNVLYILTKCGSMEWQEAPFNPHLSPGFDQVICPDKTNGYALTLCMVDSSTSIVKSLRMIGLGNKFSTDLYNEMKLVFDMPFSVREYNKNIDNIEASKSTMDLVMLANSHRWKLK